MHHVLVIAEKDFIGACIAEVLREHSLDVTVVESLGEPSGALHDVARGTFDLVIVTNTSLSPSRIQIVVPDIKARYPHARIIVLSGFFPDDFVADLLQKGTDGFLNLPYEQDALLKKVDGLLSISAA